MGLPGDELGARIVKKAGKLIDVPDLSPHWFRHAHASHALEKGATVVLVKETLGHASIATRQVSARQARGVERVVFGDE